MVNIIISQQIQTALCIDIEAVLTSFILLDDYRLSVMIQRGEISLADTKAKKEAAAGSVAKSKKATRIKALSPKAKRDEQLEVCLYKHNVTKHNLIIQQGSACF